jgi:hypothetical protein
VALAFAPPPTDVGVRTSEASAAGLTVSKAVFVTPLYVAEIVTASEDATPHVEIVKVPEVEPDGMFTVAC